MGHIVSKNKEEIFSALAEKYSQKIATPVNEEFVDILKKLYSETEALVGGQLELEDMTLSKISTITGIEEKELFEILESMAKKGLIVDYCKDGKHYYFSAPMILGFFEFTFMRVDGSVDIKEMSMLFNRYFNSLGKLEPQKEPELTDPKFLRTVFAEKIVPLVTDTKVESYESIVEIIKKSGGGAISTCTCRHIALHNGTQCDVPLDTCVSLGWMGDYIARRGLGKRASVEELLEMLDKTEKEGLVHIVDNVINDPVFWCNCCACCCLVLTPIKTSKNKLHGGSLPSHFAPVLNKENCISCGKCVDRCRIGAITIDKENNIQINNDACIGCGLCASGCPSNAIKMERIEVVFTIPKDREEQERRIREHNKQQ